MSNQIPSLTDKQLKTLKELQRIKMAWILFYFMLVLFSAAFILLVMSVFSPQTARWEKIGCFLFNGILGWSVKSLHKHLFPEAKKI